MRSPRSEARWRRAGAGARSALVFAPLVAVAGCASIIGLDQTSVAWCDRPENKHDFCEDFDHADVLARWASAPPPPDGAARDLVASDDSRPRALDTRTGDLQAGDVAITGLLNAFASQGAPFEHVAVGVDVKVVQANFKSVDGVQTGAGFLLVEDLATAPNQPTLCFGMVLAPAPTAASGFVGLALEVVPNASDCITVGNPSIGPGSSDAGTVSASPADAGASPPDAGPSSADSGSNPPGAGSVAAGVAAGLTSAEGTPIPIPLGEVAMNTWIRLTLVIDRNPADDSGTIMFFATGNSGAAALPNIPPGFLGAGNPGLGIATSVSGPAGPFEVQFDDVTVDFHP